MGLLRRGISILEPICTLSEWEQMGLSRFYCRSLNNGERQKL